MGASDPLGDMLTKIRNASRSRRATVDVKSSRSSVRILDVLKQEGFIRTYKAVGEGPAQQRLRVYLKYTKASSAITQLIRISTPGRRDYRRAAELPRVRNGLGVAVVSTSRGVMTEREAYRQRIGGEVVCYVW